MSNGWAKSCKIVAWIMLIGGVIGSIIISAKDDNWFVALYGIPSAIVSFILFGTLGYIAQKIDAYAPVAEAPEEEEEDEGERQENLQTLYEQGKLSEEDYMKALFKDPEDTVGSGEENKES